MVSWQLTGLMSKPWNRNMVPVCRHKIKKIKNKKWWPTKSKEIKVIFLKSKVNFKTVGCQLEGRGYSTEVIYSNSYDYLKWQVVTGEAWSDRGVRESLDLELRANSVVNQEYSHILPVNWDFISWKPEATMEREPRLFWLVLVC